MDCQTVVERQRFRGFGNGFVYVCSDVGAEQPRSAAALGNRLFQMTGSMDCQTVVERQRFRGFGNGFVYVCSDVGAEQPRSAAALGNRLFQMRFW